MVLKNENILECPICQAQVEYSLVKHIQAVHGLNITQFAQQFTNSPIVTPAITSIIKRFDLQKSDKNPNNKAIDWDEFKFDDQNSNLIPEIDPHFLFPKETYYLYPALKDNLNIYLAGPSGCGKSTLILQAAARMRKSICRMNLHGQNTVSDFIGKMEYEEGKGTFFKYGILPNAMKAGHWLLLDEVDFASPTVLHALQAVLEPTRKLFLPATNETVCAHKHFRVFCTANTTGKGDESGLYSGVDILNAAFLRRFQIKFKLDYPDKESEKQIILSKFPLISITMLSKMLDFTTRIRASIKKGEFHVTFSTAELLAWAHNCRYFSVQEAANITFLDFWTEAEQKAALTLMKTIGF
jgi:MoxR-like ATPase